MAHLTIARHPAHANQPIGAVLAAFKRLSGHIAVWLLRRRERAALLLLDEAQLKDIGICRSQASFEYDKPFWRG